MTSTFDVTTTITFQVRGTDIKDATTKGFDDLMMLFGRGEKQNKKVKEVLGWKE